MKILVINAGGSSLKYQLFDMENGEQVLAKGICERVGIDGSRLKHEKIGNEKVTIESPMPTHAEAIKLVLQNLTSGENKVIDSLEEISAIGHRVVHGGEYFNESVLISDEVKQAIEDCAELAPLHNPANLIGINAFEQILPGVPQVAVFDTAFHQTLPKEAYLYGLPYKYYEENRIRKYGFHGTSHKYVANRCAQLMGRPISELKIVTMHLGNGASVTAVKNGQSIDTSMGFTPVAGLFMGSRAGNIDPSILTYIMKKENLTPDQAEDLINKKSGILGITGISNDFRDIELAGLEGNRQAQLASRMFEYCVKRYIGYYASAMGGIDAVVFTAGVGENNPMMRANVLAGQEFLGIRIDPEKNSLRGKEVEITGEGATVRAFVIPTNEELMIARDTRDIAEKKRMFHA